jgi:hypothetical protein
MISGFNWGLIPSGATFQALANALLLYDDAKPDRLHEGGR